MSKKKIDPRPNKIAIMAIAIFCVAVFFGGYFLVRGLTPKEFRLDEEMYDKSEAIDIDKGTYEKLIADKKSFIIMIDKPDCFTTANLRRRMKEFPEEMQFKYYRIMWSQAKESSLHESVKFVPSVAIVREGKIIDFLDADSAEDTDKYNDAEALRSWIDEYIKF